MYDILYWTIPDDPVQLYVRSILKIIEAQAQFYKNIFIYAYCKISTFSIAFTIS